MPDALLAALSVAATVLVGLVIVNLRIGVTLLEQRVEPRYGVDDPQFLQTVGALLGPAVLEGNHVRPLYNGAQIFPAMLEAIAGGRLSITFETYIYWSGVDDLWVSVGSTHFDSRSFRINDEANLNAYDQGLARELAERFKADMRDARLVTLEDWQRRSWREKLWERIVAPLAAQL